MNTECKYSLLKYAFEQFCAVRVQLKADQRNARSNAAIRRIDTPIHIRTSRRLLVRSIVPSPFANAVHAHDDGNQLIAVELIGMILHNEGSGLKPVIRLFETRHEIFVVILNGIGS